jgi:hypothetical protein
MRSLPAVLLTRGGIAVDLEAEQHLLRLLTESYSSKLF